MKEELLKLANELQDKKGGKRDVTINSVIEFLIEFYREKSKENT